jgi:arsenate reductase-like glutaredoxin family protein
MGLQLFGTRKCADTRKAERFLKERGIAFQFVDLADKGISPGELRSVAAALGLESLVDTEGAAYRRRGLAHMEFDLEEELLREPLLLRTPILRDGRRAFLGFESGALAAFLARGN